MGLWYFLLFVFPSLCTGGSVPKWCNLIKIFEAPLYPSSLSSHLCLPPVSSQTLSPIPSPGPLHLLQLRSTSSWPAIFFCFSLCLVSFSESSSLSFLFSIMCFRQRQTFWKWAQLPILTARFPFLFSSYPSCLPHITLSLSYSVTLNLSSSQNTAPSHKLLLLPTLKSQQQTLFQNMP